MTDPALSRASLTTLAAASLAALLAQAIAAQGGSQQQATQVVYQPHCLNPPDCPGYWDPPYDWGHLTCTGGNWRAEDPCYTGNCNGNPFGEIPHAVLFLQNPTAYTQDPAANPAEWRLLLVDTGHFDTTDQQWWVWDPATPGTWTEGLPRVQHTLFCAGHTVTADGRVFFAGGQMWPPYHYGSCLPAAAKWTFLYDPEGVPANPGEGPGTWGDPNFMQHYRYYPSTLQLPEDDVMIIGGAGGGATFELHDVATDTLDSTVYPYSNNDCPSVYARPHLLPSTDPATSRGTVYTVGPYLTQQLPTPFELMCGLPAVPTLVDMQRLALDSSGFTASPSWQSGPAPVTEPNRADLSSVIVVDLTEDPPEVRMVYGAGRTTAFGGSAYDSIEMITDPQDASSTPVALPALAKARFHQVFVLLPGRRLLVLGGQDNTMGGPGILTPEWLDLQNTAAGWTTLAPHSQIRAYHSWGLLLPDTSVIHGGGRNPGLTPAEYKHAQRFHPPYETVANPGNPPVFGSGNPVVLAYDDTAEFSMSQVGAGIDSFELLRPGSVTHSTDYDQRLVVLDFTPGAGSTYTLSTPPRADLAPPGWYMLFAVSTTGIPSPGVWVQLQ